MTVEPCVAIVRSPFTQGFVPMSGLYMRVAYTSVLCILAIKINTFNLLGAWHKIIWNYGGNNKKVYQIAKHLTNWAIADILWH